MSENVIPTQIKAIIKSTNTFRVFLPKTGIAKTPPDKGATSFTTFSSPTKSQRVVNKFFYDAFTVIDITKKFEDWTITLFSQDVREKLSFKKVVKFNLDSGDIITPEAETKRKITKRIKEPPSLLLPDQRFEERRGQKIKEFKIGTTLDTTGELANTGKKVKKVLSNYINNENKQGGINGTSLKFIALEDENQPKQAKNNIKSLLDKYNTNIILSPLGGATTQSYMDMITKGSIALLFANTGYSLLRDPKLKYVINFGPGYNQVEPFAFSYVKKNIPAKKFAFFYQKKLAGDAIPEIVKNLDKKTYITTPYDPVTLLIAKKADKIKALKPDVLFMFCTPASAIKLLNAIGAINIMKMTLVGYRLLSTEFKKYLEENNFASRYIAIESLPDPLNSNLEIFKEMRKQNKEKNIDVLSAESYIAANILVNALQKGAQTKKEIISSIENMKNYNFKGLELNFDPKTRQVSNFVWVTRKNKKTEKFALKN